MGLLNSNPNDGLRSSHQCRATTIVIQGAHGRRRLRGCKARPSTRFFVHVPFPSRSIILVPWQSTCPAQCWWIIAARPERYSFAGRAQLLAYSPVTTCLLDGALQIWCRTYFPLLHFFLLTLVLFHQLIQDFLEPICVCL